MTQPQQLLSFFRIRLQGVGYRFWSQSPTWVSFVPLQRFASATPTRNHLHDACAQRCPQRTIRCLVPVRPVPFYPRFDFACQPHASPSPLRLPRRRRPEQKRHILMNHIKSKRFLRLPRWFFSKQSRYHPSDIRATVKETWSTNERPTSTAGILKTAATLLMSF